MDNILIIAPEITKGMKSIGSKALLHIKNNTAVLEYQIQQIKKFNRKAKIYIGVGFESEKIQKLCKKYSEIYFVENFEYEVTNQSKTLSLFIRQFGTDQLLVISNGVLFKNNPFSVSIDKNQNSKIFVLDKQKNNFTIGCCESDSIHYLFYDLPIPWSECVYFNSQTMKQIEELISSTNIDQLYLFELINNLIEKYDIKFNKNTIKKQNIMKINTIKDISKAKLFI